MSDRMLTIRMNDTEYEAIARDAESEGVSISSYCRKLLALDKPTSLTQIRIELSELHEDVSYLSYEHEMMMNIILAMYEDLNLSSLSAEEKERKILELKKGAAEKCIRRRVVLDSTLDPFMTNEVEDAINKIIENRQKKEIISEEHDFG